MCSVFAVGMIGTYQSGRNKGVFVTKGFVIKRFSCIEMCVGSIQMYSILSNPAIQSIQILSDLYYLLFNYLMHDFV